MSAGVYPPGLDVRRSARISDDGLYRYALVRRWALDGDPLRFVMLNPSTADADLDDPTIRRCVAYARDLGYAGIVVTNLYAYRATRPADLWTVEDPVGPENDAHLAAQLRASAEVGGTVVAAWGANARPDRVARFLELVDEATLEVANVTALGVTKAGQPRHPLYLASTARPARWRP